MARRYEIDELIWLRGSPLVAKPAGLPPMEEWMPQPDQTTTQRKTHGARDVNSPAETGTNRRPSFFEAKHISRGSNSEDIVLGPPKTAFASSRIGGKGSFDLTDRPAARPNDSDETKNDRFNFRDRLFKDRDAPEKELDRREAKPGPLTARRGEREDWNAGRPRRTFGPDEQERKPRRNGEFDRWENKEGPRDPNAERVPRDKDGRFPIRKEGQPPRSKYEGSWFREEQAQEAADADDDKPPLRNREWRQNQTRHGTEREWNRGAKFEQEPEWLDANERDEPRRAHTQEDFERWKERMKAGSGSGSSAQTPAPAEEKREAHVEEQKPETRRTDGEIFSNSGAQFMSDESMERFFGLLSDSKVQPQTPEASTPIAADPVAKKEPSLFAGKPGKSSRFAGLFSPMPESPAREPEPMPYFSAPPQAQHYQQPQQASESMPFPSHSADQEGFQRILQMLGGQRSENSTPHEMGLPQQQRNISMMQGEQQHAALSLSSPREPSHRSDYMGAGPENPMAQVSSKDPQALERAHLLRLMQQVRVGPPSAGHLSQQSPNSGIAPPPGLMPEGMPRPPPGLSAQKTPNFLDDPAIANMQRPDSEHLRRRPANGPPMGFFDDMSFPQGNQGPMTPGGSRPLQGANQPPMPLQRPPGLEHLPPLGWTGQPVPQQGVSSPMGPPPGISTPGRGMNPNFPPGMLPMPGNAPPMNERQGFPRGLPPGMMPPPGYMNGPPPGFPPMPPNPEAMMGLGPFGGNPGPQGPPPSSRHLLEMFGQSNGGDVRGGMVGPGQFR
ncbi:hypothetical protein DTO013E5_9809 [Penicillium roqueforti]|uniref:Genomic scaffold, ProqFM164S04 n=1 Tax=Penicillium roqueforti (strain FM164) TaxID=1365484 RepID=W6QI45_PENRF|nr:uncharacterized protein LCP9604111_3298 [Penicillium roqueforti]CDM36105.1 unnamed protein product [Penicillium roqueforti FM164]KAF9250396.1 hypothetical protein LCP9604111_3298 [Penicillium roqueforti]KAI1833083.1 hypothetical protein CBS147337_6040 [Penicillium roqueforti]KAI2682655.1 hypothetical protein LCP963914a_6146 [Penicillium roqueforti]KAI2701383.1 hypothetical protein CBS147354_9761 [Penicillium roqueforti]